VNIVRFNIKNKIIDEVCLPIWDKTKSPVRNKVTEDVLGSVAEQIFNNVRLNIRTALDGIQ